MYRLHETSQVRILLSARTRNLTQAKLSHADDYIADVHSPRYIYIYITCEQAVRHTRSAGDRNAAGFRARADKGDLGLCEAIIFARQATRGEDLCTPIASWLAERRRVAAARYCFIIYRGKFQRRCRGLSLFNLFFSCFFLRFGMIISIIYILIYTENLMTHTVCRALKRYEKICNNISGKRALYIRHG